MYRRNLRPQARKNYKLAMIVKRDIDIRMEHEHEQESFFIK